MTALAITAAILLGWLCLAAFVLLVLPGAFGGPYLRLPDQQQPREGEADRNRGCGPVGRVDVHADSDLSFRERNHG